MNFKLTLDAKSNLLHASLGAIAGWISFYLDRVANLGSAVGILAGIILFALSGYITTKVVMDKDKKWWIGNGGIIFILVWLIAGSILATL